VGWKEQSTVIALGVGDGLAVATTVRAPWTRKEGHATILDLERLG